MQMSQGSKSREDVPIQVWDLPVEEIQEERKAWSSHQPFQVVSMLVNKLTRWAAMAASQGQG